MKKILTSVIVAIMLLSIIFCCVACTFDSPKESVVKCANNLKGIVKYPETFEITASCGYRNGYVDDDGDKYYSIYVAIPFKITDNDGDDITEVAFFVDGSYVGCESDWYDESYEQWSTSKQLSFLQAYLIYLEKSFTDVFTKDEINSALGIGTSSGEQVGSGAQTSSGVQTSSGAQTE